MLRSTNYGTQNSIKVDFMLHLFEKLKNSSKTDFIRLFKIFVDKIK